MFFKTLDSRQQRTVIPERREARQAPCPSLLLENISRPQHREGLPKQISETSLSWWGSDREEKPTHTHTHTHTLEREGEREQARTLEASRGFLSSLWLNTDQHICGRKLLETMKWISERIKWSSPWWSHGAGVVCVSTGQSRNISYT